MRQVSEREFFATIGPQDVHPRVDVSTLKDRYHVSRWEVQHARRLVGMSKSDSWGVEPTVFHLT